VTKIHSYYMFETCNMNEIGNINLVQLTNYCYKNSQFIILFLLVFIVVFLIAFIFVSYFVLKLLKQSIEDHNPFFYQYNKKSQQLLDLYGDCKLTNLYLVRQPFSKFITFGLNMLTLFQYNQLIQESQENFPFHTLLVFEVELTNGNKKWLLLEKNNCINVCENFFISNSQEVKHIKLKKNVHTLNDVLNETRERIGTEKFFNWHLYTNNCQEFTKAILKTLGKYTRCNKEFIFRDKLMKLIVPSDFTLHIGNCLFVFYNILEKYVYDTTF